MHLSLGSRHYFNQSPPLPSHLETFIQADQAAKDSQCVLAEGFKDHESCVRRRCQPCRYYSGPIFSLTQFYRKHIMNEGLAKLAFNLCDRHTSLSDLLAHMGKYFLTPHKPFTAPQKGLKYLDSKGRPFF